VIKGLLESRDHRVTLGHRESRAYKDCRVMLGQRDRKVTKAFRESKVRRVRLGQRERWRRWS